MMAYVVVLHDGSWANTGNFNSHVFLDEQLAKEQAKWLNDHLALSREDGDSDPDGVYVEAFEISETVDHCGDGVDICDYLYGNYQKD